MYKEAKGVVTSYLLYLWLLLLATLCILLSSEASNYYNSYNHPAAVQMMRARPYYVAPHPPADNHPNAEAYPVPPRVVSSYAAPLVVMSADYQPTPASKVPQTTYKPALSTSSDPETPSSSNNNEETNYSESNVYDVTEVSLVPEVDPTYSSDDETTYWILETSRADVPYEGTTHHAPIYLPALTSSI